VKGDAVIGKENLPKKGVNIINKDVIIFVFFLLLSFVFWYLNSLGKVIETDIRYSVKFINPPKERAIVNDPQVKMNLFLKGTGFSILRLKLTGNKPPVVLDISKVSYRPVRGSKTTEYYIVTSNIVKSVTSQLRTGCEVTSIRPDTLYFTMNRAGEGLNDSSAVIRSDQNDRK